MCILPEKARSKIAQNKIVQVEVLNIMVVKLSFKECALIAFQSALLAFLASAVTFSELTLFYSLTFSVSAIIGPNWILTWSSMTCISSTAGVEALIILFIGSGISNG